MLLMTRNITQIFSHILFYKTARVDLNALAALLKSKILFLNSEIPRNEAIRVSNRPEPLS